MGGRSVKEEEFNQVKLLQAAGLKQKQICTIGDARYWSTKIPDKELPTIKSLYLRGYSQKHIAKIYSVDQSHISRIVNNHKRGRIMPSVTR